MKFVLLNMRFYEYYYRKGDVMTLEPLFLPKRSDYTIVSERVKDNPLFDGYSVIACGSMVQDVEQPKDMDLMLVGDLTNTTRIYEMLNYLTHIGINEIKVPTDALFIEDITYLSIHPKRQTSKVYDVYTCYNFELEIVKGEITKFRDFDKNERVGLLTKHQFHQPSIKALERGYLPNKYFYLTSP